MQNNDRADPNTDLEVVQLSKDRREHCNLWLIVFLRITKEKFQHHGVEIFLICKGIEIGLP